MSGFLAPACEYLVGVVVMVAMVVAPAGAAFIVLVVVVMLVVVAMALFIVVMMVMMLVVVAMALLIVVVVVMMLVLMAMALLIVVMVMMMLVLMAMALLIMVMMVMVMAVMMTALGADLLLCESLQLILKGKSFFHCRKDLLARKLAPVCCDDLSRVVVLFDKIAGSGDLFIGKALCVAENDGTCAFDLIVEEFAEILHIHLALLHINHCSCGVELYVFKVEVGNRLDNVGKLANS